MTNLINNKFKLKPSDSQKLINLRASSNDKDVGQPKRFCAVHEKCNCYNHLEKQF